MKLNLQFRWKEIDMKTVIWGTGQRAFQIVWQKALENIDFFIDSNLNINSYLGKKVYHPNDELNWEDLYIYVPTSYFDEVEHILINHGLVEYKNYERHMGINEMTYVGAESNLHYVLRHLRETAKNCDDGMVASWGGFWCEGQAFSKFYCELIQSFGKKALVVQERAWQLPEFVSSQIGVKALVIPIVGYVRIKVKGLPKNEAEKKFQNIKSDYDREWVREFADSIMQRNTAVDGDSALYGACVLYRWMDTVLKSFNFRMILLNGSDAPERIMLSKLCRDRGIPCLSTHPAIIPGAVTFDPGGDIGSSMPAVYYKAFRKLSVSKQDKECAREVLQYLREKKLNRKKQPQNDAIAKIKSQLKPEYPVIFCAAQCDDGSCLIPYTEESKKYHSPMFASSIESAVFLAEICKKNNWNLIYKSHPMYVKFDRVDLLPDNVIYVDACDINDLIDISDVVVTIRSTTNYVALIREKPVLMLGYTQTRGQGCTYEAFEREAIESQLQKAIIEGYTKTQKEAFVEHVARLLKYYLYDDTLPREIRYGLPMPEKLEDFFELGKKLQEMDSNMKDEMKDG